MPANVEAAKTYPQLSRFDTSGRKNANYTVSCFEKAEARGKDNDPDFIDDKFWFATPPLDQDMIDRLWGIQLFTNSFDQGYVSDASAGNWNWFEIAIYENDTARNVKVKDGVALAWEAHSSDDHTQIPVWTKSSKFNDKHEIFGLLEPGNVIGVRLCARFAGWGHTAVEGHLIVNIGSKIETRSPPKYEDALRDIQIIQETLGVANEALAARGGLTYVPTPAKSLGKAGSFSTEESLSPLKVLSLDGGGVRGLISLYILKDVMEKAAPGKKPCEIFDMIAGTSAGGLTAMMLGRLEMSVDECIKAYIDISEKIFGSKFADKLSRGWRLINVTEDYYKHSAKKAEQVFKDLVKSQSTGRNEDTLLYDPKSNSKCKVFVTTIPEDGPNNSGPILLRSYRNPEKPNQQLEHNWTIWEAARATSAAPLYFEPISVDGSSFVDGGLLANNPLGWLWNEVLDVYGAARSTACFLSIGTGIPPKQALGRVGRVSQDEVARGLSAVATNTQLTHILFKNLIDAYAPNPKVPKYWRLNVGLYDPTTGDYKDEGKLDDVSKMKEFKKDVEIYLASSEKIIGECVKALQ